MSGLAAFCPAVIALLKAAGTNAFGEYDTGALESRARCVTVGQGAIVGSAPEESHTAQTYPLKVSLRICVLDHAGTSPGALLTEFEDNVLTPLLQGGYVPAGLVVRPAEYCRNLDRMQLEATVTLPCGYLGEEAGA